MPPQAHWLADTLRELAAFTGTGVEAHDDVADALVHLWALGGLVAQVEIKRRRIAALPRALPFG